MPPYARWMSSWFATVLERISTMPGVLVSITAAAASSHEDSIPRISIVLSMLAEAVQMMAPAVLVVRWALSEFRVRAARADRDLRLVLERLRWSRPA